MAVGGPLVISSNAAPLKWRPFSSCFNLSPLLQRYIRLLSIAYLSAYNNSIWLCLHPHICTNWPPFFFPWAGNTCNTAIQQTHAWKQKTLETGILGGDDMYCLFNHVLWDDSVIILSSARFNAAKLGRHSMPCSLLIIPYFKLFMVKSHKTSFFFLPVFIHFLFLNLQTPLRRNWNRFFFFFFHIKPIWQALCVNT